MTTQLTQDLLTKYGWRFIPSHDIQGLHGAHVAIPECWVHDDKETCWTIEEVLEEINNTIELQIESELE